MSQQIFDPHERVHNHQPSQVTHARQNLGLITVTQHHSHNISINHNNINHQHLEPDQQQQQQQYPGSSQSELPRSSPAMQSASSYSSHMMSPVFTFPQSSYATSNRSDQSLQPPPQHADFYTIRRSPSNSSTSQPSRETMKRYVCAPGVCHDPSSRLILLERFTQPIYDDFVFLTEVILQKTMKSANKQLQDTLMNYFLENHVSNLIIKEMNCVSKRAVRFEIEKNMLKNKSAKYMNLLNAFEQKVRLFQKQKAYENLLMHLITDDNSTASKNSEQWKTLVRKRILALLLIVHWHTPNAENTFNDFFAIWDAIYPSNPLPQKPKKILPPSVTAAAAAVVAAGTGSQSASIYVNSAQSTSDHSANQHHVQKQAKKTKPKAVESMELSMNNNNTGLQLSTPDYSQQMQQQQQQHQQHQPQRVNTQQSDNNQSSPDYSQYDYSNVQYQNNNDNNSPYDMIILPPTTNYNASNSIDPTNINMQISQEDMFMTPSMKSSAAWAAMQAEQYEYSMQDSSSSQAGSKQQQQQLSQPQPQLQQQQQQQLQQQQPKLQQQHPPPLREGLDQAQHAEQQIDLSSHSILFERMTSSQQPGFDPYMPVSLVQNRSLLKMRNTMSNQNWDESVNSSGAGAAAASGTNLKGDEDKDFLNSNLSLQLKQNSNVSQQSVGSPSLQRFQYSYENQLPIERRQHLPQQQPHNANYPIIQPLNGYQQQVNPQQQQLQQQPQQQPQYPAYRQMNKQPNQQQSYVDYQNEQQLSQQQFYTTTATGSVDILTIKAELQSPATAQRNEGIQYCQVDNSKVNQQPQYVYQTGTSDSPPQQSQQQTGLMPPPPINTQVSPQQVPRPLQSPYQPTTKHAGFPPTHNASNHSSNAQLQQYHTNNKKEQLDPSIYSGNINNNNNQNSHNVGQGQPYLTQLGNILESPPKLRNTSSQSTGAPSATVAAAATVTTQTVAQTAESVVPQPIRDITNEDHSNNNNINNPNQQEPVDLIPPPTLPVISKHKAPMDRITQKQAGRNESSPSNFLLQGPQMIPRLMPLARMSPLNPETLTYQDYQNGQFQNPISDQEGLMPSSIIMTSITNTQQNSPKTTNKDATNNRSDSAKHQYSNSNNKGIILNNQCITTSQQFMPRDFIRQATIDNMSGMSIESDKNNTFQRSDLRNFTGYSNISLESDKDVRTSAGMAMSRSKFFVFHQGSLDYPPVIPIRSSNRIGTGISNTSDNGNNSGGNSNNSNGANQQFELFTSNPQHFLKHSTFKQLSGVSFDGEGNFLQMMNSSIPAQYIASSINRSQLRKRQNLSVDSLSRYNLKQEKGIENLSFDLENLSIHNNDQGSSSSGGNSVAITESNNPDNQANTADVLGDIKESKIYSYSQANE